MRHRLASRALSALIPALLVACAAESPSNEATSSTSSAVDSPLCPSGDTYQCTNEGSSGGLTCTCVPNPLPPITVSGRVTGLLGSGLELTAEESSGFGSAQTISITHDGHYAPFPQWGDATSIVVAQQPTNPTQACAVAYASGTPVGGPITNIDVTCTDGYTVGGTVTGMAAPQPANFLEIGLDGVSWDPPAANGPFTFAWSLADGQSYAVTLVSTPSGQQCTVLNGTGTIQGGNVTDVLVECANLPCGANGENPCVIGTACSVDGAVDTNGECECPSGDVVTGGLCSPCGAANEPACAGATCSGGLVDHDGDCVLCGAAGQPPCAGNKCDNSGLVVSSMGICVPCGALGEEACANDTCDPPLGDQGGVCAYCGGAGEPECTAGQTCLPGLVDNTKGICVPTSGSGSSSGGSGGGGSSGGDTSDCALCFANCGDGCIGGLTYCEANDQQAAQEANPGCQVVCIPDSQALVCGAQAAVNYCNVCADPDDLPSFCDCD